MKPLVIYHANCADGFGAAFAAWLTLGDEAEYVPMRYIDSELGPVEAWEQFSSAIPSRANTDREVYILDFSFPRSVMDKLFEISKRVVWLDHHKTAFEMWEVQAGQRVWAETEGRHVKLHMDKSGAYLAWEYFHPGEEVPMFIEHIDDYDRWQFKIEGTKAFNKAIWSHAPWSFKQWVEWFYDYEAGFNHKYWADFYTEGKAILRAHDQNVQAVVKGSARGCRILHIESTGPEHWQSKFDVDAVGLAANCPSHLTSDVGHELANSSSTYGLCWTLSQTDLVAKCSLRSNGDYDVSAIAKAFGGGGHRNAAGFEVPIQTLLGWLK